MGVFTEEKRYMITVKDSDNIYIVDCFDQDSKGIKFIECDNIISIPYDEIQDIQEQTTKSISILSKILG